ncbi:unnamed protein product [Phytophthora lilii]|uniref:Unnamed protein product n=1 Tax=Phytophthora lilii TaxID=2077276 RepID=A0A9W6YDZ7_9STRA|nr:unnamed protein product [Phytophthora lilii]
MRVTRKSTLSARTRPGRWCRCRKVGRQSAVGGYSESRKTKLESKRKVVCALDDKMQSDRFRSLVRAATSKPAQSAGYTLLDSLLATELP